MIYIISNSIHFVAILMSILCLYLLPDTAKASCLMERLQGWSLAQKSNFHCLELPKESREHLATAEALFNQGDVKKSQQYVNISIKIAQATLGKDHPEIVNLLHNSGKMYATGNYHTIAESYIKNALIRYNVMDKAKKNDLDINMLASSLGQLYQQQHLGNWNKAKRSYNQTLQVLNKKNEWKTLMPDYETLIHNTQKTINNIME